MLKKWFANEVKKLKYRLTYDDCYENMRSKNVAGMGICHGAVGGDTLTDYLSYHCINCPYLKISSNNLDESK